LIITINDSNEQDEQTCDQESRRHPNHPATPNKVTAPGNHHRPKQGRQGRKGRRKGYNNETQMGSNTHTRHTRGRTDNGTQSANHATNEPEHQPIFISSSRFQPKKGRKWRRKQGQATRKDMQTQQTHALTQRATQCATSPHDTIIEHDKPTICAKHFYSGQHQQGSTCGWESRERSKNMDKQGFKHTHGNRHGDDGVTNSKEKNSPA
jgi:hypothetical protein